MNIFGSKSDEFIFGTDRNDFIVPRGGFDIVFGGKGNDVIMDTKDDNMGPKVSDVDVFFGGEGNDRLITTGGRDALFGGKGNDDVYCESLDSFYARGGLGHDVLHLGESSRYNIAYRNGVTTLTLDSDEVHQTISVMGFEEIVYDAPMPL